VTDASVAAPAPMDPSAVKEWRKTLRADLIARRMHASREDRVRWGRLIDRHVEALLPDVADRVIGLCWPYKCEHDSRASVLRMVARGARAAMPVVVAPKTPLAFREWHAKVEMVDGAYGIPEPAGSRDALPDVVLLPSNGFDEAGYRLGYGGGYFDRTMASLDPRPLVIGIAFELGRLATIHPQPHDIPLDYVVTEAGAYQRGPRGLQRVSSPARC
jgi:5-formyltetrahydrofolate cyclo-ligase